MKIPLQDLIDIVKALKDAKDIIKTWHCMGMTDDKLADEMWNIYEKQSPEMIKLNSSIEIGEQRIKEGIAS